MDWSNVSVGELAEALREVDWAVPPRPLGEFFKQFAPPKSVQRWAAMFKCNLYYYRTNYALVVATCLVLAFLRNPLALIAVVFCLLASLCTNTTFATSAGERLTRLARSVSPPLAIAIRKRETVPIATAGGLRGASSERPVFICGARRWQVVAGLSALAALLLWLTSALVTIAGALALGFTFTLAHASLRSPHLKARLDMGRHEFRAVWRNFRDA